MNYSIDYNNVDFIKFVWSVFNKIYINGFIKYGELVVKAKTIHTYLNDITNKYVLIANVCENYNTLYVCTDSKYFLVNNKYIIFEADFNKIKEKLLCIQPINYNQIMNKDFDIPIKLIEGNYGIISNGLSYNKCGYYNYKVLSCYFIDFDKENLINQINNTNSINEQIKIKIIQKLFNMNKIRVSQNKNTIAMPLWISDNQIKLFDSNDTNIKDIIKYENDTIYYWINLYFSNDFIKGCYGFYKNEIYHSLYDICDSDIDNGILIFIIVYCYLNKLPNLIFKFSNNIL